MNEVTLKQYPGILLVKTGAQISWTKNQTKPNPESMTPVGLFRYNLLVTNSQHLLSSVSFRSLY